MWAWGKPAARNGRAGFPQPLKKMLTHFFELPPGCGKCRPVEKWSAWKRSGPLSHRHLENCSASLAVSHTSHSRED